jgi:hypothetical protein
MFKSRFGSIFEDLKLQRKRGVSYYTVFTLRRLVFAFVLVFVGNHLCFQVQANFAISIAMIIYLGKCRPWEVPFNN